MVNFDANNILHVENICSAKKGTKSVVVRYRSGVKMLILQGKWALHLRTPASFGKPVSYTLEEILENGISVPVNLDAPAKGRKKAKVPAGILFDLTKLDLAAGDSGDYILQISYIKEGTTAPFTCTSFTERQSAKAAKFRFVVTNSKGETLKSAYLIICNNKIKDLASMPQSYRDKIEAALEGLVYEATLAWKLLEDFRASGKSENIKAGLQLYQGRPNSFLEEDILTLFCHPALKDVAEASFASKFGEKHGDEEARLQFICEQVQMSARGDDSQKVARGLFFVYNGRIKFCCTTDNKETKEILFSCLDERPGNEHDPRCEIDLVDVLNCVNNHLFTIMPPQKRTGKRRPGRGPSFRSLFGGTENDTLRELLTSSFCSQDADEDDDDVDDSCGLFAKTKRSPCFPDAEEENDFDERFDFKRLRI